MKKFNSAMTDEQHTSLFLTRVETGVPMGTLVAAMIEVMDADPRFRRKVIERATEMHKRGPTEAS
jgi:hypothetical protein